MMRLTKVALFAGVLLVAPAMFADEWVGWITDEHCGAKGANSGHKSCALKCADGGAALVFYNTGDEKIYKLSDQAAARKHTGHEVKVVGTVEGSTIKIESIDEAKAE